MAAKVYVVTKAEMFEPELYVTVKASMKEAEKVVREKFPNARKSDSRPGKWGYECKDPSGRTSLMFVTEETV